MGWEWRPQWSRVSDRERWEGQQQTHYWPHLHKVNFKAQDGNRMLPHCHALFVHIESRARKSGAGARQRKKARKNAAGGNKMRSWGGAGAACAAAASAAASAAAEADREGA
eukprot:2947260-Pyramimonas_sp.AAC.1